MQVILNLTMRNMKKYFRDRAAVFFSFLSIFIVIFLYLFFLADMQVREILNSISGIPGYLERETAIRFMVNSWLVAGLLTVNTITIPISILSMNVEDKYNKIGNDFHATPAKRHQIVMGYIISAWIIGFITSLVVLAVGEAYIVFKGGTLLGFVDLLKVLGILAMSIIMFSGMFYIIVIFLNSSTQVATVNTLVGTFSGFLGGIYVPLGILGTVGTVIKFFPLAHIAALLRQVFMKDALEKVFWGAPESAIANIRNFYGVDLIVGTHLFKPFELIMIIAGFTVLCYGIAMLIYGRMKRKH